VRRPADVGRRTYRVGTEHEDGAARFDRDGEVVNGELVDELELAPAIAPVTATGAVSPYVAAQPRRVSAEVLAAADPAAPMLLVYAGPPSYLTSNMVRRSVGR
jgi:hypothetical protein